MFSAYERVTALKFGRAVASVELWRNGSGTAAPAENCRFPPKFWDELLKKISLFTFF